MHRSLLPTLGLGHRSQNGVHLALAGAWAMKCTPIPHLPATLLLLIIRFLKIGGTHNSVAGFTFCVLGDSPSHLTVGGALIATGVSDAALLCCLGNFPLSMSFRVSLCHWRHPSLFPKIVPSLILLGQSYCIHFNVSSPHSATLLSKRMKLF